VVSAQDEKTLNIVADVYGSVVKAGIHRAPSKTTRELAVYVAKAKGLDGGDVVMRKAIGSKIIHVLRIREKQGQLVLKGKLKGVSVRSLPPDKTLI
jgi:hypothetical protein